MTALEQIIRAEIAERGPMDFARYMELALYHPKHGFYAAGHRRTGWGGQFVTSPELDPAYGELWAEGFERIWHACGRPSAFDLVEIGPGEGSFAAAVISAVKGDFASALRLHLVERVEAVRTRQAEVLEGSRNVSWIPDLDEMDPVAAGCLFSNEVIDNMPVAIVENRGGTLVELCVGTRNAELALVARPPSPEILEFTGRMDAQLPDGHRMEIPLAAIRFASAASRTILRGAVVLVDYGDDEDGLMKRPAGTLLCYSDAGVDDRYLESPGTKDITSHANWSALSRTFGAAGLTIEGPKPQRDVLKALGVDVLHDRLRREANDALQKGLGAAGVRALSRRGAIGALLDPAGLGGLGVLVALKGISPPAFILR